MALQCPPVTCRSISGIATSAGCCTTSTLRPTATLSPAFSGAGSSRAYWIFSAAWLRASPHDGSAGARSLLRPDGGAEGGGSAGLLEREDRICDRTLAGRGAYLDSGSS